MEDLMKYLFTSSDPYIYSQRKHNLSEKKEKKLPNEALDLFEIERNKAFSSVF
jgi:hypothetical protein